jgi:hypothetical protein
MRVDPAPVLTTLLQETAAAPAVVPIEHFSADEHVVRPPQRQQATAPRAAPLTHPAQGGLEELEKHARGTAAAKTGARARARDFTRVRVHLPNAAFLAGAPAPAAAAAAPR